MIQVTNANKCKAGAVLQCGKCNNIFGMAGRRIKSLRISFICDCGGLETFGFGNPVSEKGNAAIYIKDTCICPVCGEILFRLNKDAAVNFAYRAKCACGSIYNKYKESGKVKRRLGTFALYDSADSK